MAKVKIVGSAAVVISSKKLEDIKTLEKYRPKALSLFSEDGKEALFTVGSTVGKGSIGKYGASFGDASHDEEKLATITLDIPSGVENATEWAVDTIGVALNDLNKVESQIKIALEEVLGELDEVRNNIAVV